LSAGTNAKLKYAADCSPSSPAIANIFVVARAIYFFLGSCVVLNFNSSNFK
jgi:hypothetical protein